MCNLAVLVALQVQVLEVGARTHQVSGEVEDERKKEEEKEGKIEEEIEEEEEEKAKEKQDEWACHAFSLLNEEEEDEEEEIAEDEKEEDMLSLSKVPCFQQNAFPVFVEGVGNTIVVMISPQMDLEDFVEKVQTKIGLSSETFFLSSLGRMLDSVRMKDLTRDSSVRVNFRLRGGMMRVPRDSPGQWTCDYCGITRCWATRSTCYRCGEARGHTEELQRHYRNVAREASEKGTSNVSVPVASSSTSPPWAAKAPPPRSVPPRTSSKAPWAPSKSLSEVDKIHDSDQTALLRTALALFENCDLPPGVLDEIRKVIPPHRPPTRKAPKGSREQIVLNMKKKLEKEEQELRDRNSALDQARKLVTERQQKVMDQAKVVSDLKMQLVEIRQNIANSPTPEVSEGVKKKEVPKGKDARKMKVFLNQGVYALTQRLRVFKKPLFLSLRCSGPIPDISGFPVVAGVFDVPSRADLPASVLCTSGTALPKVMRESKVVIAGSQVEQEERVTGDTPPARLGCAVPVVENDLLRASRVKFDTLSIGADTCLRTQLKPISGCAGGSRCGSAGVLGRRALRSLTRSQALVSPSDRRVVSLSQVDDKFASNFFHIDASSHVILISTLCILLARLSLFHLSLRGPSLVFLFVVVHVSVSVGHDVEFLRNMLVIVSIWRVISVVTIRGNTVMKLLEEQRC